MHGRASQMNIRNRISHLIIHPIADSALSCYLFINVSHADRGRDEIIEAQR